VADSFEAKMAISGVVLTKMDGDARGGAALSIKHVTGKSIKFVGMGEKVSDLEIFHPDRVASRILGMGDVLTLIEKAQETMGEEEAERLGQKFQRAEFDFEDFRTQMRRLKKIGSFESILKLIPGMGALKDKLGELKVPDKELGRVEAMINSMTLAERRNPALMDTSRKERIARGSGVALDDVNQLVKNFDGMRLMMQHMMGGKKGKKGKMPGMPKLPPGMAARPGMGMPRLPGAGGMPGLEGLGGAMPGMGGMPGMGEEQSKSGFTKAKKDRKKRVKPAKAKKKKR